MNKTINVSNDILDKILSFVGEENIESLLLTSKTMLRNLRLLGYQDSEHKNRIACHAFINDKNNKDIKSLLTHFNKLHNSNDKEFKKYVGLVLRVSGINLTDRVPFEFSSGDNVVRTMSIATDNGFVEASLDLLNEYSNSSEFEKIDILSRNRNLVDYLRENIELNVSRSSLVSQSALFGDNQVRYFRNLKLKLISLGLFILGMNTAYVCNGSENNKDIAFKFIIGSIINCLYVDFAMAKIRDFMEGENKARMIFSKQMPEFTRANIEVLNDKITMVHNKLNNH